MTKKKILNCYSNDLGHKIINILKKKYDLKILCSNKLNNKKHIFVKNKKDFELKLKKEKECYDFLILIPNSSN